MPAGNPDPSSLSPEPPLPPLELMTLAGSSPGGKQEVTSEYLEIGTACRRSVLDAVGPDWSWQGKRMLDFGCGAGRLLRHLLDEAREAEIYGTDLDPRPVDWASEHLCPPIAGVHTNGFDPPLDYAAGRFDLVSAFSVFTHLSANWAEWLLEIRRILEPDGLLIASLLSPAFAEESTGVRWNEDEFGMSVFDLATPGMPYVNVAQSEWWLREHWGRAFEIVSLDSATPGHRIAVLRPRPGEFEARDLLVESSDDPRYLTARRHQEQVFAREADRLRRDYDRALEDLAFARRLGPLANLVPRGLRHRLRGGDRDRKGVPQH